MTYSLLPGLLEEPVSLGPQGTQFSMRGGVSVTVTADKDPFESCGRSAKHASHGLIIYSTQVVVAPIMRIAILLL